MSALNKSKGTAGGGSLSAPTVKTLTDAEKAGDKILDLGPGVRRQYRRFDYPLDDSSYSVINLRNYGGFDREAVR